MTRTAPGRTGDRGGHGHFAAQAVGSSTQLRLGALTATSLKLLFAVAALMARARTS